MANRFYFLDSGSQELPDNGTFETEIMSIDFEGAAVVIAAYDASGDIVTPSVGTATVSVEPISGQKHATSSAGDNPVDLTKIGATATYITPTFAGPVEKAYITIADADVATDGIDHFKAFIWRF